MTAVKDEAELTWRDHATCVGLPITHFFPLELVGRKPNDRGTRRDPFRHARAACAACSVRRECLHDALAEGELEGFRAGLTPDELRNIARRRRQEATSWA